MKAVLLLSLLSSVILYTESPVSPLGEEKRDNPVFQKAIRYFYQKKFEMAELLFQEELKNNPENELAYSYLGDIFFNKNRYDGALKLYRKSLDINPNIAENYYRIGQVYYYKKIGDQAIVNFEKSYKLNPNLKFAFYHVGLSYLMLIRDKDNTIKNWETFLEIAPEDSQYEKIRRAVELLKDPNFVIPPIGSEISIEEALHLGGEVLVDVERRAKEKKADHESKKTKQKLEGIYKDDDL
ncbi:MAG: tetratricopeptide repeat protein [Spirochaetota bacterium]|nr:tetratricopeptide repeat protein [Spirochaetota bacterium]